MLVKLSRTELLIYSLKKIIFFFLALLLIFALFRVFFALYFGSLGLLISRPYEVLQAFILGLRYDSMVISYTVVPAFLLISIFSLFRSRKVIEVLYFFLHKWFFITSIALILLLICDMGFYLYFQEHMNILFFGFFEDDTVALLTTIYKNYPLTYGLIALSIFLIVWYIFTKKIFRSLAKKRGFIRGNIFSFLFVFISMSYLFFGMLRGSFSDLPLSPSYVSISSETFINQMAINGIITFHKAYKTRQSINGKNENVAELMGYKDEYRAFSDYLGFDTSPTKKENLIKLLNRKTGINPTLDILKPHVIVFVMESFGTFWLKYHSNSFNLLGSLETHYNEDITFDRIVSSDNGTIGSLTSIMSNIPNRPGVRFLNESKYLNLKLESSSLEPYLKRGYETTFLYGGKLAWRNIGYYAKNLGFHNVVGEDVLKNNLNLKGKIGTEWGIFDEHLFNYVYDILKKSKRPQFILVMTTTNHPPYEVPESYEPKPLLINTSPLYKRIERELSLVEKRFLSYQYANDVLGNFISSVKNDIELKENTIISFTGDHNFWGFINYSHEESFEKYKVPFYVYAPINIRPKSWNRTKLGAHTDIMTTLYDLSLSDTSFISFGKNLFNNVDSFAINSSVIASKNGAKIDNKFFPFESDESSLIKIESVAGDPELEIFYRSLMATSDYFLKLSLEASKLKND